MNLLPKVYVFMFLDKDDNPNTGWAVARTAEKAVTMMLERGGLNERYTHYCYNEQSWFWWLLALVSPVDNTSERNDKPWSDWTEL